MKCVVAAISAVVWVVLSGTVSAQTFVSGPVSGTWTVAGSPYVVHGTGATVTAPAALTIEAGVVVQFEPGTSFVATGDVQVNGTAGNEVVFQAATQPGSPGDWQGIELGGGIHLFTSFQIMDAAAGIANGLSGASDLTVSDGTFSNTWTGLTHENSGALMVVGSQFLGPGTGLGLAAGVGTGVSILGNVFDGCAEAMTMAADSSPGLNGNTAVNCGLNGARLFGAGPITGAVVWDDDGMPRVLWNDLISVAPGGSLLIESGTVIKSLNDFGQTGLDVAGSLSVSGTSGSPVIFTSLRDDSVAGDTNADGAASVPAPGDWDGVTVSSGSASFTEARIEFAGTAISSGLSGASHLTVTASAFAHVWTGITHENTGDLAIEGCAFQGPGMGVGLAAGLGPNVTVQNNSFDGCDEAMTMAADSSPVLGGNTAANGVLNGTRIYSTGPIVGAATWDDDGMPLVLRNDTISVAPAGSLTIEAGTVIKSLNDFSATGLDVAGTLTVSGAPTNPVVFTSLRDDAVMGDTNGDAAATVPAPGDWDGVTVSGGDASFTDADFSYASTAISSGLSGVSDLTVTDSAFAHVWTGITHENTGDLAIEGSVFHGPGMGVGLAPGLGPNVTVQNNSFDGCDEPMTMAADSSPVLGGNTAANGVLNGTRIYSTGPIVGAATWDDDGMPLVLRNDTISVAPAGSLTIEAGTVIKSLNDFSATGLDVAGTLTVSGAPTNPVVFTSLRDDAVMGDTNGDAAATVPAPGDWDGVTVSGGDATVADAGFSYAATAIANGLSAPSNLAVTGSFFADSWTGITHEETGNLTVTGSEFFGPGMGIGLAAAIGPNVVVQNNSFDGCAEAMTMAADSSPVLGGNTAMNGVLNGTRIYSTGPIVGAVMWHGDSMPLVLWNDTVTVDVTGSLTIEAGTVLKSLNDFGLTQLDVGGALTVNATRERPAIFTSLLDDAILGDTNGDGGTTVPSPGDWDGIAFTGSSAQLTGAEVRFATAGLDSSGGGALQVRDSIFTRCFSGALVSGTTSGYAGSTLFVENGEGLFVGSTSTFQLGESANPDPAQQGDNDIYCNSALDLAFDGAGTLLAQSDWWGETPPDMTEIQTIGGGTVDLSGFRLGPVRDTVDLSASRAAGPGVDLTWQDVATCIGYRVQRDTDPLFASPDIDDPLPPGSASYSDATSPPRTILYYRVFAE